MVLSATRSQRKEGNTQIPRLERSMGCRTMESDHKGLYFRQSVGRTITQKSQSVRRGLGVRTAFQ